MADMQKEPFFFGMVSEIYLFVIILYTYESRNVC